MTREFTPEDPFDDWGQALETAEDYHDNLDILSERVENLDPSDQYEAKFIREELGGVAKALEHSDLSAGEQSGISALLTRVRESLNRKIRKKKP